MDYFSTVHLTSICHRDSDVNAFASLDAVSRKLSVAKCEVSIAQTITEGIHRFALEVTVSTVFHAIVSKFWQLSSRFVECNRQFTRWVEVAKDYVSHSCTTFLTRIPCLQQSIVSVFDTFETNTATRAVYVDNRLASFVHSLQEASLYGRKFDSCTFVTFTFLRWSDTTHVDDSVSFLHLFSQFVELSHLTFVHINEYVRYSTFGSSLILQLDSVSFAFLHFHIDRRTTTATE